MAGGSKDLRYNVAVDASDASSSLKKLSSDVKKTAKDIESSFDDSASAGDRFKQTVDQLSSKLSTEFTSAASAADKLGSALKGAGSKMDVGDAIADLTRMGFTFDEITADADKFATSLKQLDDVKIEGVKQLDNVAPGLATKLDSVEKSAGSSKSALANMVGNSAQDLGSVAGVAGSAGVAIGQMAEYFADAKFEGESLGSVLKNFATVAGPIALLSLAVGAVSAVMGDQAAEAELAAKNTAAFGDASKQAANDATAIADVLRENQGQLEDFAASANDNLGDFGIAVDRLGERVPLIGRFFERESVNVVQAMGKASISVYDFSEAVEAGGDSTAAFNAQLEAARDAGAISGDEFRAIKESVHELGQEYAKSQEQVALYNVDQAEANALLQEMTTKSQPMSRFQSIWKTLMKDMADGSIDTENAADAVNYLADQLGLTTDEVLNLAKAQLDKEMDDSKTAILDAFGALRKWTDEVGQAVEAQQSYDDAVSGADWGAAGLQSAETAMSRFSEEHFALRNIAAESEAAFDGLNEAIKKNGKTFDLATEAGRANDKALQDVARSLDEEFSAAYADANGSLDTFNESAKKIAEKTLGRLQKELGLSDKQTADLAVRLGLLPEDIETRYKLAGDEEAKAKIGLLQSAIDNLPKDVQTQVTQKIILGDYVGALAIVEGYYSRNPADLKTEATAPGNLAAIGAAVSGHFKQNPIPIQTKIITGDPFFDAGGTVGAAGGFAGERGPELLEYAGRLGLTMGATAVAPGTKVTSTRRTRQILRGRVAHPAMATAPAMMSRRVDIGADVRDVERAISRATRPRTMRIDVQAVPSSVLTRVNGGG